MSNGRPKGRAAVVAFVMSATASLALMVVYILGGEPRAEGVLLAVALGGLGFGLILWAHDLMPGGHYVEEREDPASPLPERRETEHDFKAGAGKIGRRRFLGRALGAALGALGVAALFPIRSLGQAPGSSLLRTHFRGGMRLVTQSGAPVSLDDLEFGGFLTVFPEGHTDAADSQTVLIRIERGELEPVPGREEWTPDGFVAYSKICTHAGCPVGLYERRTQELFCPCHQSIFDASEGARPTAGPATRALPQLPLGVDEQGFLIALDDFSEPVGPGFWSLG
jgi:ubiquinol-cytochrome c reductase iron-sulfur subunit